MTRVDTGVRFARFSESEQLGRQRIRNDNLIERVDILAVESYAPCKTRAMRPIDARAAAAAGGGLETDPAVAEVEEYLRLVSVLLDVCAGDLSAVGPRLSLLAQSAKRLAATRRGQKGRTSGGGGWGWGALLCWWSDEVREALSCYADSLVLQGHHNLLRNSSPPSGGPGPGPAQQAPVTASAIPAAAATVEVKDGIAGAIDAVQRGLRVLGDESAEPDDGAPPGPAVAAGPSVAFGYDEARVRPVSQRDIRIRSWRGRGAGGRSRLLGLVRSHACSCQIATAPTHHAPFFLAPCHAQPRWNSALRSTPNGRPVPAGIGG